MKDKTILSLAAIVAVTTLELFWVYMGHNHNSLALAVGVIAALAGYKLGVIR